MTRRVLENEAFKETRLHVQEPDYKATTPTVFNKIKTGLKIPSGSRKLSKVMEPI